MSSCRLIPVAARRQACAYTEAARLEIKIQQQRNALRAIKGAWKREDHRELAKGAAAWASQAPALDAKRFEELERRRDCPNRRPFWPGAPSTLPRSTWVRVEAPTRSPGKLPSLMAALQQLAEQGANGRLVGPHRRSRRPHRAGAQPL